MKHEFICSVCKLHKTHESEFTTGYATNDKDEKICFDCCGKQDAKTLADLKPGEKFSLYLNTKDKTLTNWPGTFRIDVPFIQKGRHNIAGNRYDTWFCYGENQYHAVQYGDYTQIAHIRRLKRNHFKTA